MATMPSWQTRQWLLLGLVCLLLGLAWFGRLDSYSHLYLSDSIKSTGVIYGIARGINALVSVLQSSEISVMLVSVNIGELLDPLNDLIERFSHVLVVALGALVLQKILLEIVAHGGFSLLLTALGLLVLYSTLFRRFTYHSTVVRFFVLALFLRFALVVTVLAGSLVDRWFLEEDITQQTATILQLENQLATTRDALTGEGATEDALNRARTQVASAEQALRQVDIALLEPREQVADAEQRIARVSQDLPWYERWLPYARPEQLVAEQAQLQQLQRRAQHLQSQRQSAAVRLESADETLVCMKLRAEGKSCSVFEWFETLTPQISYKEALTNVAASMDTYVENIVDLLVGVLLKSVVLPILLLYGLYRAAKWAWSWGDPR